MTFYTDGPLLEPERQTIQEVRQIRQQEAARQIAEAVRIEKRLADGAKPSPAAQQPAAAP